MDGKAVSEVTLTVLLIGILVSAFGTQEVKTEPTAISTPNNYITMQPIYNESVSHDIPICVVFVGYNQELIDTLAIDSALDKYYELKCSDSIISYRFNLEYFFADDPYYQSLRSLILQNSVNGSDTTSRLNETALEIQIATETRMSIFLPQSGRAINASAVEDWLALNPYVPLGQPRYTFYIMNFTDFDSPDHTLEH